MSLPLITLLGVAVLLTFPALVLLVQVLAAARRSNELHEQEPSSRRSAARTVVLIPAHNEASDILTTLTNVRSQLGPLDSILVVADNCTDGTATLARRSGAGVMERFNATMRGKGHALNHGVREIAKWATPPDVVVVVDADCVLDNGALTHLTSEVCKSGRPVQALYLMHAPPNASRKVRIAEFAWLVKNLVRPAGMHSLGLPCQLMGTGMGFPWEVLRDAPLANGHLVEDMKLGTDLARYGFAPVFCQRACVRSQFPSQEEGLRTQRARWEQGHISVILHQGIGLLVRAAVRGNVQMLGMALDVCVPPLASLVVGLFSTFLLTVLAAFVCEPNTMIWSSLIVLTIGMLSVSLAVTVSWVIFGRTAASARDLIFIPSHIFGKFPIYLGALFSRRKEWIRTKRDREH